jgi:DNA adenine methylase
MPTTVLSAPAPSPASVVGSAAPLAASSAAEPGSPILKWVGGKSRMLPHLLPHYTGQGTVIEPFFGGGALSFSLAGTHPGVNVVANDMIVPLVEIYEAVRDDVERFIADVEAYAAAYLACPDKAARRQHYYAVRQAYMTRQIDGPAPLFFMLWCGYSGMYRTGKTYPGRFNTPHGFGGEAVGFYHPDRLRAAAKQMATWTFLTGDFADCFAHVTNDSFVFLDPPYRDTYDGYTGVGFSDADQLRVVEFFKAADAAGAKVVYTNKYSTDGWYEREFAGFTIATTPIRYSVNRNCATVGRPQTLEVVISN